MYDRQEAYPHHIVRYPLADTTAPAQQLGGVIMGRLVHAQETCSHMCDFKDSVAQIFRHTMWRGYSRRLVQSVWSRFLFQRWHASDIAVKELRAWFSRVWSYLSRQGPRAPATHSPVPPISQGSAPSDAIYLSTFGIPQPPLPTDLLRQPKEKERAPPSNAAPPPPPYQSDSEDDLSPMLALISAMEEDPGYIIDMCASSSSSTAGPAPTSPSCHPPASSISPTPLTSVPPPSTPSPQLLVERHIVEKHFHSERIPYPVPFPWVCPTPSTPTVQNVYQIHAPSYTHHIQAPTLVHQLGAPSCVPQLQHPVQACPLAILSSSTLPSALAAQHLLLLPSPPHTPVPPPIEASGCRIEELPEESTTSHVCAPKRPRDGDSGPPLGSPTPQPKKQRILQSDFPSHAAFSLASTSAPLSQPSHATRPPQKEVPL